MFINCSQCFVTDSNISCAKYKTAFRVILHRDKVQDEESAHITPPHNTVFLQYSQYSASRGVDPVLKVGDEGPIYIYMT